MQVQTIRVKNWFPNLQVRTNHDTDENKGKKYILLYKIQEKNIWVKNKVGNWVPKKFGI